MVVLNSSPQNNDSNGANVPEFSVAQLSSAIKKQLETGFSHIRVRAEVGRVTVPKSGHVYLDLKDDDAVISAIIWKGVAQNLATMPSEGMEVVVTGRITTFAGQSKYQIIIEKLEPAGAGAILLQLEERRKRLAAEGLFDADKKRAIPFLPKTIGVVTSPTGAVIRDILHRISERFPCHVIVWRVLVQGDKAAGQIAAAIDGFNAIEIGGKTPRPDLIIVARGGGSIEDLWAFNEEIVVRAAANSKIPLISAVGHETDTTLIDYASDLRAPTPTGAAEYAVPVRTELLANNAALDARLKSGLSRRLLAAGLELRAHLGAWPRRDTLFTSARQRFDIAEMKLVPALYGVINNSQLRFSKLGAKLRPQLLKNDINIKFAALNDLKTRIDSGFTRHLKQTKQAYSQTFDKLSQIFMRLNRAVTAKISVNIASLENKTRTLAALDYNNVLKRGFALVLDKKGNIVKDIASAKAAHNIKLRFADGEISAKTEINAPIQGTLL